MADDLKIELEVSANTKGAVDEVGKLNKALKDNLDAADAAGKGQRTLGQETNSAKAKQIEQTEAIRRAKDAQQEHTLTVQAFGAKSREAAQSAKKLSDAQDEARKTSIAAAKALKDVAEQATEAAKAEGDKLSPATRRAGAELTRMSKDAERAAGDLRRLELQTKSAAAAADKGGKSWGGMLASFGGNLAASGVAMLADGLKEAASWIIHTGASYETLKIALETTTGSAAKANAEFARLQQFAMKTPYGVEELTQAFIKLENRGIKATDRTMTAFGNTASAMGKSLDDMVEAVADAVTGENERLKEFGVVGKLAGDQVMYTFRGVTTAVKRDAASIQEYLTKLGEQNFAGGMEKQSKSLAGMWSSLTDQAAALADGIFQGLAPALKEIMGDIDLGSDAAKEAAVAFGKDLAEGIKNTVFMVKALYEPLKAIADLASKASWIYKIASGGYLLDGGMWREAIALKEEYIDGLHREQLGLEDAERWIRAYAVAHGGAVDGQLKWIQNTLLSAEAQERVNDAIRLGLKLEEDKRREQWKAETEAEKFARERAARDARDEGVTKRNRYAELSADKTLSPSEKKEKLALAKELDVPGDPKKGKKGKKQETALDIVKRYKPNEETEPLFSGEAEKAYEKELSLRQQKIDLMDREMELVDAQMDQGDIYQDQIFFIVDLESEAENRREELTRRKLDREMELAQWEEKNAKDEQDRIKASTKIQNVEHKKQLASLQEFARIEAREQTKRAGMFEKVQARVVDLSETMVDAVWQQAEGQKGAIAMALGDYLKGMSKEFSVRALGETAKGFAALAGIYTAGLAPGYFKSAAMSAGVAIAAGAAGASIGAAGQSAADAQKVAEEAKEKEAKDSDKELKELEKGGGKGEVSKREGKNLSAQTIPISYDERRRGDASRGPKGPETVILQLTISGPVIGAGGVKQVGRELQKMLDEAKSAGKLY